MEQDCISEVKRLSEREREQLLEKVYQLMANGVVVRDPHRLDIRGDLICGRGVELDINVVVEGNVVLDDDVDWCDSVLSDCKIGRGTVIHPFSLVEGAVIGQKSFVGPYGRVRPGSRVDDQVQIGNFVEVKNAISLHTVELTISPLLAMQIWQSMSQWGQALLPATTMELGLTVQRLKREPTLDLAVNW